MKSRRSFKFAGVMLVFAFIILMPGLGAACVWVNGHHLSYEERRNAERVHGGEIACGNYVYNSNTGAWWDLNRQRGGYIGEEATQRSQGRSNPGGSRDYSVTPYAGGYVGGDGNCTTIFIPSSNYTYLGDGC